MTFVTGHRDRKTKILFKTTFIGLADSDYSVYLSGMWNILDRRLGINPKICSPENKVTFAI